MSRIIAVSGEAFDAQVWDGATWNEQESKDALFAVWDGQAGTDKGSTGAVVAHARSRGIRIEVIWPAGAQSPTKPAKTYPGSVTT